jgi:hypothetical protein
LITPAVVEDPQAEAFSRNTLRRLFLNMIILLAAAAPVLWAKYGAGMGLSLLIGGGISMINFYWLQRTLAALADAVAVRGQKRSSAGVVLRFLLRYLLIAVAAYAIFKSSAMSMVGLCAGLSLPVGAILIEAGYALYGALRRGL